VVVLLAETPVILTQALRDFPQYLQANAGKVPLPSKSFQIHHSSITLPFDDAIYPGYHSVVNKIK
jgi:hypothetical protein